MALSSGKFAKFISDRSGQEFPYSEMVIEWNGARVHISEFDAQGLLNARPARTEPAVARVLTLNPFKITNGSTTVNVFEENHGRSTSDTVRFRNGEGSFGIATTDINKSAGFTITKVDANNYTFTAAGTATASTNIGGGSLSAGPVTLSA